MRKIFFSEKEIGRVVGKRQKNKKKIEKELDAKLCIENNCVMIESKDVFQEYIVAKILEALSLGFSLETALQLQDTDFILKKINIKNYIKASRASVVKGRIIGRQGRTKYIIERLSECDIAVSNCIISIIGRAENVDAASHTIQTLIRGSPQSKAYAFLERNRARLKELAEEDVEKKIEK